MILHGCFHRISHPFLISKRSENAVLAGLQNLGCPSVSRANHSLSMLESFHYHIPKAFAVGAKNEGVSRCIPGGNVFDVANKLHATVKAEFVNQ